ncbi:MAG: hypothetical protein KDJ41_09525 [Hyphomicrobiaceae bacterium]|nr:hypothetical protein [Hyphomicrobiaceae bacterium]
MDATEVHAHARKLFEAHGVKAIAEAAQKANVLEAQGEADSARDWRRIEAALRAMQGPRES